MIIANHSIYQKHSKQLNYLKTIYSDRILIFYFNLIKECILCHLDEVIADINKRFESPENSY
jgi:hypothetical protein